MTNDSPTQADPPGLRPRQLLLAGAAILISGALGFWETTFAREHQQRGEALHEPVTRSTGCAAIKCRPAADACFDACSAAAGAVRATCGHQCLGAMEACVEHCDPPLRMTIYNMAAIVGGGRPAPDFADGQVMFNAFMGEQHMTETGCYRGLARAYVRVGVNGASGKAREVHVHADPSGLDACVAEPLRHATYPKFATDYEIFAVLKP